MVSQPRINSALVVAIRMAKAAKSATYGGQTNVYHFIRNESRPEKAFTTERAKKAGKANACSGQIFVTIAPDHFGPILAENDPKRNVGVLVGEMWEDRMECRQWGAHFPHVAGIAGQSDYGAQSVALSGGYEDDEDHGDWFLYTGSGGRDLSGNKRTNKEQAFDQKFEKLNAALRISCLKGYPIRVVRDTRSADISLFAVTMNQHPGRGFVNRDLMDLIESLEDKTEEEKVEQQIEDDTSEEGCISANDTEEAAEEATYVQDIKLSKEESDNVENGKLEAAEGDSEVNVLDSKVKEADEKDAAEDTIDVTNSELSCKRKNHLACRRGVKRTRNNEIP
ncbi:hypothetical protein GW17_00029388 [Ensete ventricosum]|nr:hypothetical protein GW17_00029388 [Ensete ventricosum]